MDRRCGMTVVETLVALVLAVIVLGGVYFAWSASTREMNRTRGRQILEEDLRGIIRRLNADFKSMRPGSLSLAAAPLAVAADSGQARFQVFGEPPAGPGSAVDVVATISLYFEADEQGRAHFVRAEEAGGQSVARRLAATVTTFELGFERPGPAPDGGRYRWTLTPAGGSLARLPEDPADPPGEARTLRIDFALAGEIAIPGAAQPERLTLKSSAAGRAGSSYISNF